MECTLTELGIFSIQVLKQSKGSSPTSFTCVLSEYATCLVSEREGKWVSGEGVEVCSTYHQTLLHSPSRVTFPLHTHTVTRHVASDCRFTFSRHTSYASHTSMRNELCWNIPRVYHSYCANGHCRCLIGYIVWMPNVVLTAFSHHFLSPPTFPTSQHLYIYTQSCIPLLNIVTHSLSPHPSSSLTHDYN